MLAPRAAVVLGACGSGTPTSLSEPDTRGTGCGNVRTSGSVGGGARQTCRHPDYAALAAQTVDSSGFYAGDIGIFTGLINS